MTEHWDYIIIGGGVIGLNTAYQLTKAGVKPLIIEQFNLPHTRGSSHGQSRLIRKNHIEESYAELVSESYNLWQTIEKEGGKQLLIMTGLLLLQNNYGKGLKSSRESMERLNLPYEWLDGEQLKQRYPMIKYSPSHSGILDKSAAIILSDKALNVLQRLVEEGGANIRDGERVQSIRPGAVVTIETNKRTYTCNKVIVATGPWSKELTDGLGLSLPIKTMPGRVLYWSCTRGGKGSRLYDSSSTPAVLHTVYSTTGYSMVYSVPTHEYPDLIKCIHGLHLFWRARTENHFQCDRIPMLYEELVNEQPRPYTRGFFGLFPTWEYPGLLKTMPGRHIYWQTDEIGQFNANSFPIVEELMDMSDVTTGYRFFVLFPACNDTSHLKIVTRGEPPPFYCHPDDRDKYSMQPMIDLVADYITEHFPTVETKPSIVEPCMYCLTPDKNGIVGRHPKFHNILIATAFSGKGFMLAPLVGKVMSELAMDKKPSADMTCFSIGRFVQNSKL